MQISKSKIKCLHDCSLLFKFKYIDHKLPDIPPADVTKIGTDIHKIFHDFFDNIKLEEIPEQPYEYFCNSMKVDDRYRKTFNHFCRIESDIYKLLEDKKTFIPLLREKLISANNLTGIIDRVDYHDGNYSIIDYKSNVSNESSLRFELCFYKYLIEQSDILDEEISYIGSYGYRDGLVFFEKVNERSYNSMLKKVDAFQKLDFSKMEFAPKYQDKCMLSWCEFPKSCAEFKKQMRV